jgi:hypothetical protein
MPYKIGLVGKPSVGKSTFFNAATMKSVDEGNYPFTTIDPSVGEAYVRVECAAPDFNEVCDPREGFCTEGTRFVPVKLVDVAGLIPGANEGRGLGNKFLTDLNEADVLIHIVDFSGKTDLEGEPTEGHDPREDIEFLKQELNEWYKGILQEGISKYIESNRKTGNAKIEEQISQQMSAFKISKNRVKQMLKNMELYSSEPDNWNEKEISQLSRKIRKDTKPMVIAANKMDQEAAVENYKEIKQDPEFEQETIIPVSAHAEKALKNASEKDKVEYTSGESNFTINNQKCSEEQIEALEEVKSFNENFGGTGIQECLETALFTELGVIAVFPGGSNGLGDDHGNILPDCFLIDKDSTAIDFAYELHTDLGEGFLHAVDVRKDRKISSDKQLEHRDVVEIVSSN